MNVPYARVYPPAPSPTRSILLECYKRLRGDELSALPQRLSAVTAEASDCERREEELQAEYARLAEEAEEWRAGRVPAAKPVSADMDLQD